MKAEFDKILSSHDNMHQEAVGASGYSSSYFYEYKVKEVHRILSKRKTESPISILDFGCGVGNIDPYIRKYFPGAQIYGVDISQESINIANYKNKEINVCYAVLKNNGCLPFKITFDLIFISTVFHHIPKKDHLMTLTLIEHWMKPEALLFIFEHNPYNPVTRLVFSKYDMQGDENANLICPHYLIKQMRKSGFRVLQRNYTLFFPKPLSIFCPLEKFMTGIPFGAQYYIVAKKDYNQ